MNFHPKSKPKTKYDPKIFLITGFFLGLFLLSLLFPNVLRGIFTTAMKPLWLVRDKTFSSSRTFVQFFVTKNSLIKDNTQLEGEVASLRLSKVDYDVLLKENEELKKSLGVKSESRRVTANVLSKPPQSLYDTFIIDIGSNSGVNIGDEVYISDTILIGLISKVTGNSATVKLFSTGGEKSEVVVSRTGAFFTISGSGGANFQIEVPKDTDILWGDTVSYPSSRNTVIGIVYFVDSNSQSSFKTVYLRIPGNVFQAKKVFVGSRV